MGEAQPARALWYDCAAGNPCGFCSLNFAPPRCYEAVSDDYR